MSAKCVIFLSSIEPMLASWVRVHADGSVRESVLKSDLALLSSPPLEEEVIVIVPASDVLITEVVLPKMNRATLAKALPYALEDQLVDEVSALHFAYPDQAIDGRYPVLVVSSEKMASWLDRLKSVGITPSVMLPLSLALPFEKGTWSIAIDETVAVRMGEYRGFSADIATLPMLLNLAMLAEGVAMPGLIRVDHLTANAIDFRVSAKVIQEQMSAVRWHEQIACGRSYEVAVNLLQGPFAQKRRRQMQTSHLRRWLTRSLAAMGVILFLTPVVSLIILSQRLEALHRDIAVIYHKHFPLASSVVAPKGRMNDLLQKIASGAGENRLLVLLSEVGRALHGGVSIKRVQFQGSVLTLVLSAESAETLSAFRETLMQQGLSVKQQQADLSDGRINATFQVT